VEWRGKELGEQSVGKGRKGAKVNGRCLEQKWMPGRSVLERNDQMGGDDKFAATRNGATVYIKLQVFRCKDD